MSRPEPKPDSVESTPTQPESMARGFGGSVLRMATAGKVVQVTGPVVDARFSTDSLPEINNAIVIRDE